MEKALGERPPNASVIRQCITSLSTPTQQDLDRMCEFVRPPRGDWQWSQNELALAKWTEQRAYIDAASVVLEGLSHHTTPEIYTCMIYYAYDTYPWVNTTSRAIATNYLTLHDQTSLDIPALIKPKFVSGHTKVSAAGRKKVQPQPNRFNSINLGETEVPWRSDLAVVALFEYLVRTSPNLQQLWPFIIPTTLNIIDDHSPPLKTKGCELAEVVMERVDPKFFKSTGLQPVVWDAILPCLSYLPPGTTVDESVPLVSQAIDALVVAAKLSTAPTTRFDELMRVGIIRGFKHSGEQVALAMLLLNKLDVVVERLKLGAVRHLGALVTILAHVFSDPFGNAYKPLIDKACVSTLLLLKYCWPRIDGYKLDLVNGLARAYRNVDDPVLKQKVKSVYNAIGEITTLDKDKLDKYF